MAGGLALVLALLLGAVLYWWAFIRFHPPPSIFDTPVDDVAGYLSLDDFSQLPVEERMRFLLGFADRFRGLSQSESAVLAGFLAGLSGPARDQLLQNMKTLAKDILADGARRYLELGTASERSAFMDAWLVEWMKTGERMTRGKERERSDGERLAAIKRDGQEESARRPSDGISLDAGNAVEFLDFWQREVETTATPKEQGQIVRFLTDLRDHVLKPQG